MFSRRNVVNGDDLRDQMFPNFFLPQQKIGGGRGSVKATTD